MRFYNREDELERLQQWSEQASKGTAYLTTVVGRRRVGKTALLNKTFPQGSTLGASIYLFVSRKQESLLCEEFIEQIRTVLNIPVFGQPTRLREVMEILLQFSITTPVTVILDEFQDIQRVNKAFFSELQDLWDRYREQSRMHLICCGSLYSLMTRLFQDGHEPLFGRADHRIHLQPLSCRYIAQMLNDQQAFTSEKLLQWYMLSGGVPKYLEWLFSLDSTADFWPQLVNEHSLLIEEGHYRLAEEFGPEHSTYFSILAAIASGSTSRPDIESLLGISVGPQLDRLEKEFDIIRRIRSVLSKPGTRLVKYRIADAFLAFWFRFIYKYRSAVEIGNFPFIHKVIERDYPTWSGHWLEEIFREVIAETGEYNIVGSYWDRGNQNEIDLVAINELDKKALIAEIKRNPKNIRKTHLQEKSAKLVQQLRGYEIEYRGFSLDDLADYLRTN
ncbi:ATP-binding protein [Endozoicomonas sp. 4G]|uniref:ATP-binding protein n=1 Tax=Endozoicomonas sp. 4G TaxID=2872754 RepID=UPI0020790412|nr:ATP-binding protein [Endozoicomonas sp. 4G]